MATYWEKLRDPRWQRKRLEIMERADFMCEDCGDKDKTLNVHHKLYRKGANPWDYADHELECLCEDCHEQMHSWRDRLNRALAMSSCFELEHVAGYAEGIYWRNIGPDPGATIEIASPEHASGVCAAFGNIFWESVVKATDKDNRILVTTLFKMLDEKNKK